MGKKYFFIILHNGHMGRDFSFVYYILIPTWATEWREDEGSKRNEFGVNRKVTMEAR